MYVCVMLKRLYTECRLPSACLTVKVANLNVCLTVCKQMPEVERSADSHLTARVHKCFKVNIMTVGYISDLTQKNKCKTDT